MFAMIYLRLILSAFVISSFVFGQNYPSNSALYGNSITNPNLQNQLLYTSYQIPITWTQLPQGFNNVYLPYSNSGIPKYYLQTQFVQQQQPFHG